VNSQRENYASALSAMGGYVIVNDLLNTPNHWIAGVVFLIIGTLLFLWPEGER